MAGRPTEGPLYKWARHSTRSIAIGVLLTCAGCATPAPPPAPPAPVITAAVTWEQKLRWIMRLEDQRIVRDPNPPPAPVLAAQPGRAEVIAPPPPSDLIRLLADPEARVRRRAVLALGRVGLPEASDPLMRAVLNDSEVEVRQMAAFALGLLHDGAARGALLAALKDADPSVQGSAAEALGLIGDRADAQAISDMVQAHVKAGALAKVGPDEVGYPLGAPIEASRRGIYALARLGSFEALASAVLDANGQPVSTWWPVAYALQRVNDQRASRPLLALLSTPGRYTASFSARGLGALKATSAAAALRAIVERPTQPAVAIQAVRALGAIGDAAAVPILTKVISNEGGDPLLRLDAVAALGTIRSGNSLDLLLDLMSDMAAPMRGAATRALADLDPDVLLTTLSGLDPDRDWTVRTAQAEALGKLPPERSGPRLLAMLGDKDQRVIPKVLAALVASKASGAESALIERLKADDFAVRAAAANGLAELKSRAAIRPLFDAYQAANGDSTYVARAAFIAAVAAIDPVGGRPLIEAALKDREWPVRVKAASSLGSAEAITAIRPATGGRPITDAERDALMNPPFSPHAYIDTEWGTIELELAIGEAPLTVANFMALARRGFFNGLLIHRVVADFVLQAGDPRGDSEGGPGYAIRDELNQRPYLRGTVGMALDWQDTAGSQFFIAHSPLPQLDGRYTAFGQVVNGMDVVEQLLPWDVIRRVRIWDGVSPPE